MTMNVTDIEDQIIDCGEREVQLLAEMIAAGEKNRALELLAEIFPGAFEPQTVSRMVSERTGMLF